LVTVATEKNKTAAVLTPLGRLGESEGTLPRASVARTLPLGTCIKRDMDALMIDVMNGSVIGEVEATNGGPPEEIESISGASKVVAELALVKGKMAASNLEERPVAFAWRPPWA
jgi:hypothetical protein